MKNHPDRETLTRFVSGDLPPEEVRRTDRHLEVCSECRERADEVSSRLPLRLLDEALLSNAYDEVFDRVISRASQALTGLMKEARSGEDLLAELLKEPAPMRRRRIRSEERFQTFELSQLLRLRSRDARFSEPATALEMADLAVEVAQHLDSGQYGLSFAEGARALAWGYLANAWRINSDLWRAEAAMSQAWLHHMQAGQDTYTETEILNLTASLRDNQGLYE
ncbi:MAG TPA: zf-HC2 domain-containing protein, partial [Thermoanaerobaculia bacterium]|nr:zf-HC2 domain-containing protein [Thermoanaerobaculia bacterium]